MITKNSPIRELIQSRGGPTQFRRDLEATGVEVPALTARKWSARSAEHCEPPLWATQALRIILQR